MVFVLYVAGVLLCLFGGATFAISKTDLAIIIAVLGFGFGLLALAAGRALQLLEPVSDYFSAPPPQHP